MGHIHVLPPDLADRIAAGEVVERPASAVKELVENAIDAGAGRITVDIRDGGVRMIRVIDDGRGMDPEDAALALRRHTTSKISTTADLFDIHTFGFRGEALASIASVSRLTLTTRTAESPLATRIVVDGGIEKERGEVGAPVGTTLLVEDLFHNIPARRKFLKTRATEFGHIEETVRVLALARPDVHFRLTHDERQVLDLPPADAATRAAQLLGRDLYNQLFSVSGELAGMVLSGLLSKPGLARPTAGHLYYFVNGRRVRDKVLQHALMRAYGTLIDRGRWPVAVLLLDVPPHEVDVNVSPAKSEVRFLEERRVYAFIHGTVERALRAMPWLGGSSTALPENPRRSPLPSPDPFAPEERAPSASWASTQGPPRPLEPFSPGSKSSRGGELDMSWNLISPPTPLEREEGAEASDEERSDSNNSHPSSFGDGLGGKGGVSTPDMGSSTPLPFAKEGTGEIPALNMMPPPAPSTTRIELGVGNEDSPAPTFPVQASPAPARRFFRDFIPLGQYDHTYLLCETPRGLAVVDQHAAHERVTYERLRSQHRERGVARQGLLVSFVVAVSPASAAAAEAYADEMRRMGYDVEPTGADSVTVRAVPAALLRADHAACVRDLLDEFAHHGVEATQSERIDKMLATIACHASKRAGDRLSPADMAALFATMDEADLAAHCPHGRPVYFELPRGEIERRFGRR